MRLTLKEAAVKLGVSERQIRYAIQQGRLSAKKEGGRWFVELAALPRTEAQEKVKEAKERRVRRRVEDALSVGPSSEKGAYSVRNLRAFQAGAPLWHQAREYLGDEHPVTEQLRLSLEHLSVGCHRFLRLEKAEAYGAARDAASRAVCALNLGGDETSARLARQLERDLMPAFSSLLRRSEGRRR